LPKKGRFLSLHGKVIPFELKLPEEIQLLTFLAPAALIEWSAYDQRLKLRGESSITEKNLFNLY
ncbi:MAG: hypothetical protein ACXWTT_09155, partial [Methylobacter sp.]